MSKRIAITIVFETGEDTTDEQIAGLASVALTQITDPRDEDGEPAEFETYAQGVSWGRL